MIFCPLYSGSSGNSVFISSDNARILIDAGLSGKAIENALKAIGEEPKNIDAIFVTHEHIDHVKGIGVLSRRYNIPIYSNMPTWKAMHKLIGNIKDENIKILQDEYINIKDLDIINFEISHDAAAPRGYVIGNKNKKACVATDMGYFSQNVKNAIKDCDAVLLESNHDENMLKFGPYPYSLKRRILSNVGHLSNFDCGSAILDIMTDKKKFIYLGHLSKINNYPDLAYKTVANVLEENNIKLGQDINLNIAERDKPSYYLDF